MEEIGSECAKVRGGGAAKGICRTRASDRWRREEKGCDKLAEVRYGGAVAQLGARPGETGKVAGQVFVAVGPWRSWERVPVKPGKSQAKFL